LNYRAISRLNTVLSDAQLQRIGGLPEPQEGQDFTIYW